MILCYFLRLLSEMAFYFVCSNCFTAIANVAIDSFVPAILLASVGTLAFWMEEKYSKYRFCVIPLLALVFFFAKGLGTGIMLFLPTLYIALCIKEKRYFVDAETQANLFRWGISIAFVVYFLFAMVMKVQWVVQFVLLFLFVNMFLMRLLRQNPAYLDDKKFLLTNLAHLSIAMGVTMLFTNRFVVGFMKNVISWTYLNVLEPLLNFVVKLLYLCGGSLYILLFKVFDPQIVHKKWEYIEHPEHNWLNEEFIAPLEEQMGVNSLFITFLQIVFLIAGTLLVLFIIKKSRKGKNLQEGSAVREKRRAVTERRPEEKIAFDLIAPKEPRAAVRFYYRKFLYLCKKLDYKFPDYFTSQHIAMRTSRQFGKENMQELRQLYIRARYSGKDITEADVAYIKEKVEQLKERFEPKKNDD